MTTAANKVPDIYGKILKIQEEVGAIPKNGIGPSSKGSFKFIKAEDVLDKIHSLLVANGVIVVPTITYSKHEARDQGGRQYITATIAVRYEYISVSDGSSLTTDSVGEGSAIGDDTATRKAATQALKISHLHMFTIPNGEFDDEGYEPPAASAPQQTRAQTATAKAGDPLLAVRTQVKVAAGKKKLASADLNAMGTKIDEDFFNSVPALTQLLGQINSIGGE